MLTIPYIWSLQVFNIFTLAVKFLSCALAVASGLPVGTRECANAGYSFPLSSLTPPLPSYLIRSDPRARLFTSALLLEAP